MSLEDNIIYQCNAEAFGGGELGRERLERLNSLHVAVVGAGLTGQMVLASLYGLGVGNIYLFDNSEKILRNDRGFLHEKATARPGTPKDKSILSELERIDPDRSIRSRHGKFCEAFAHGLNPDVIIETTNIPQSKEAVLNYAAKSRSKPLYVISLASDASTSAIGSYYPKRRSKFVEHTSLDLDALLHREFERKRQGGYTSGIVSGLATEEVRKIAFRYDEDDRLIDRNQRLVYNTYSSTRDSLEDDLRRNPIPRYNDKKVLVVGAGALGNWAEIYLSKLGLERVDFVDPDVAEEKNLNRQIELRGTIGESKAKTLSKRMRSNDRNIKSTGYFGSVGETGENILPVSMILEKGYDAILGCVDSKSARIWMDQFCTQHGIPYIDGGTDPTTGQVAVYVPGETRRVSDMVDISSLGETNNSCQDRPNPSVVMSNEITSGLMIGELCHVFNNDEYSNPITRPLKYDNRMKNRIKLSKF